MGKAGVTDGKVGNYDDQVGGSVVNERTMPIM